MMAEPAFLLRIRQPVVREKATYCFDCVGLEWLLNLYV